MLEQLKKEVYEANMELPRRGLITYTWGNVSGRDAETGYFVIKPSGVDYDALTPDDMVVMDLNGNKIEGKYKPSSDTATHIELYKKYPEIGGIVHTHSPEAVAWAPVSSSSRHSKTVASIRFTLRQFYARTTDRSPGARMQQRPYTTQSYSRKLQRWHATPNSSIRR